MRPVLLILVFVITIPVIVAFIPLPLIFHSIGSAPATEAAWVQVQFSSAAEPLTQEVLVMALRRFGFVVRLLSVLLLFVSWSSAQVQNGQFAGVVTDPTGAAIANAKVTVSNPSTNFTDTTATNQSGLYNLKELPVGTYKITVEAPGFKTVSNNGVSVNAGTVAHLDFKMQVGQTHEIVEVSGEAAAVNTEDSKMATTVGSTQIANLPGETSKNEIPGVQGNKRNKERAKLTL
jgi:hypothetical protein